MASSLRLQRLSNAIKKGLSEMIQKELEKPLLITILEVKLSHDLQWADVLTSIFPFEKREEGMRFLASKAPHFQFLLNRLIPIRHTPKIRFKEDYRMELGDYDHET